MVGDLLGIIPNGGSPNKPLDLRLGFVISLDYLYIYIYYIYTHDNATYMKLNIIYVSFIILLRFQERMPNHRMASLIFPLRSACNATRPGNG